jgi:hypothetical protein
MAIVFIVHDLTVINLTEQSDLPEDNPTVTRHSESIAKSGTGHLFLCEEAIGDDGSAEMTACAEVT